MKSIFIKRKEMKNRIEKIDIELEIYFYKRLEKPILKTKKSCKRYNYKQDFLR